MRKILLASTALVAAAGISAASAEISFSGDTKLTYTSTSSDTSDNTSGGENGTAYGGSTNLGMSYSTTTDSGLAISVSLDVDSPSSGGSFSITGDWGTLTVDEGNEAMGVGGGDADSVENMRINDPSDTIDYTGGESIGGGRVAYSNSIGGIEFGIGLGDAGTDDENNETSYGVAYSSSVNGADVSISYAAASEGAADTDNNTVDSSSTSLAIGVTVGDVAVSMAQNTTKKDANADNSTTNEEDVKSTNFGVTYAVTDSLTLQAASVAASGTWNGTSGYKYDESAYGVMYTIASGMTLAVSYSDYSQEGGSGAVSGSGTVAQLKIAF